MRGREKLTLLVALLDYYSDKASAEASAIVATTFGLFAVLTQASRHPWMFFVYWILWGAGTYFLMGFKFWSMHCVWTIDMIMERTPLEPNEDIDHQIKNHVRDQWARTFLRNLYCFLKIANTDLSFRRWVCEHEGEDVIRLSDFLHTFFSIFGWTLSFVFFREETCSLGGIIFSSVLLFLFFLDGISIALHHRLRRGEK